MQSELKIIEAFFQRVCERAENTIQATNQIEGAHYAAMMFELEQLRNQANVSSRIFTIDPPVAKIIFISTSKGRVE